MVRSIVDTHILQWSICEQTLSRSQSHRTWDMQTCLLQQLQVIPDTTWSTFQDYYHHGHLYIPIVSIKEQRWENTPEYQHPTIMQVGLTRPKCGKHTKSDRTMLSMNLLGSPSRTDIMSFTLWHSLEQAADHPGNALTFLQNTMNQTVVEERMEALQICQTKDDCWPNYRETFIIYFILRGLVRIESWSPSYKLLCLLLFVIDLYLDILCSYLDEFVCCCLDVWCLCKSTCLLDILDGLSCRPSS